MGSHKCSVLHAGVLGWPRGKIGALTSVFRVHFSAVHRTVDFPTVVMWGCTSFPPGLWTGLSTAVT